MPLVFSLLLLLLLLISILDVGGVVTVTCIIVSIVVGMIDAGAVVGVIVICGYVGRADCVVVILCVCVVAHAAGFV